MRHPLALAVLGAVLAMTGPARTEFHERLVLGPHGCRETGSCTIMENFAFVDSRRVGWVANAGDKTNGADIPFQQRFPAIAWNETFLRAVVLHDQ